MNWTGYCVVVSTASKPYGIFRTPPYRDIKDAIKAAVRYNTASQDHTWNAATAAVASANAVRHLREQPIDQG